MKIDSKLNANYNRLLAEVHSGLKSWVDIKKYRDVMKSYDPKFPLVDDVPISMKDITTEQMGNHMYFIRKYSARSGYRTEDTTQEDYDAFMSEVIMPSVSPNIKTNGKDSNECSVICSKCGCSTRRVLTDARLKEIISIQLGDNSERGGANSFTCLECFKEIK